MVEYLWKIMFLFSERNFYPHCIHVVLNAFVGCSLKILNRDPVLKKENKYRVFFGGINVR